MLRNASASAISPQEKQRLIQIALTMDAAKLARQLISESASSSSSSSALASGSEVAKKDQKNKVGNAAKAKSKM